MDGMNRFAKVVSSANITRSRFLRPSGHKTTFNTGELVPIYLDEVLPGDTVSMDTAAVVRMSTPIFPVMDNAYLDIYYFFVPMRLVWEHAKEFFGENTEGPWESETEYTIPTMSANVNYPGSVADHFGLPIGGAPDNTHFAFKDLSVLPLRAYALIWNEWFRDQNVSTPIYIPKDDSTITLSFYGHGYYHGEHGFRNPEYFFSTSSGCLPVGKFHDYFTSALPEPQKGPAVTLPVADMAPLSTADPYVIKDVGGQSYGNVILNNSDADPGYLYNLLTSGGDSNLVQSGVSVTNPGTTGNVNHTNLYADLTNTDMITINSFRQALALQGLYELDARAGTRYREIIKSHFGVTSPDARMQVPEFLHGKRVPVTMAQVLQTSATDSTSPQGNTAAYSLTQDAGNSFTYSATEHGYLIGLCCVRTAQTYQHNIQRMWSRKRRFDFYWPIFANLGEQPIYNKEIYADYWTSATSALGEEVFGFQEAWAEYRYKPSMITGYLQSKPTNLGAVSYSSLDVWHYSEDFVEQPTLSPDFIYQDKEVVSRTLAVTDQPQFIADFQFNATWVRPMPMYSVPALLGRM